MNRREQIEAEAAGWLARVDRGLSAEEEAMFARWKTADVEHRIIFLQLRAVWQRADRLTAMRQPSPPAPHN